MGAGLLALGIVETEVVGFSGYSARTPLEVASVARNKVSRWILLWMFLLTVGQLLDISSRWLSSPPKMDGSVSGGWKKGFRCDEAKKPTRFYVNLPLSSCSHFTGPDEREESPPTIKDCI